MTKIIDKEKERIRKVAHLLYDGARRIRILRSIDWPASVKQGFFAKGAKELPVISYPGFDAKPIIDIIRERCSRKSLAAPSNWIVCAGSQTVFFPSRWRSKAPISCRCMTTFLNAPAIPINLSKMPGVCFEAG